MPSAAFDPAILDLPVTGAFCDNASAMVSLKGKPSDLDPQQIAEQFLQSFVENGDCDRTSINRLVDLATADHEAVSAMACRAIFTSVIERLSDAFDPSAVTLYNRLFGQIVQRCRSLEPALHRALSTFGLRSETDLFQRAESLRHVKRRTDNGQEVETVILLSRVTVGADIAITSVLLEGVKRLFPGAEIIIVGSEKVSELFNGDPRLRFNRIEYGRGASLKDRLLHWIDLLDAIDQVTRGAYSIVIDPDSRLTQLGLLPVLNARGEYLFFPSREFRSDRNESLGDLSSNWLRAVFGIEDHILPNVSLSGSDRRTAREIIAKLRRPASKQIITINLGVGENAAKRIGDEFERKVLSELLRAGKIVVLDRGIGVEESKRADALVHCARQTGNHRVAELNDQSLSRLAEVESLNCDLLVWQGRIGLFAALIGESDLYLGYDSACQHIAAALATPCLDVFSGYGSTRVLEKWKPAGRNLVEIIDAGGLHQDTASSLVLDRAFSILARSLLRSEQDQ